MAVTFKPIFTQTLKTPSLDIENADGTTAQTLLTAGTDGTNISSLAVTSTDTSVVTLQLYINDLSTDFLIGEVDIPIGAGTDGGTTPAVNLLDSADIPFMQNDGSLPIQGLYLLKVAAKVAVTAARKVTLTAFAGDY